MNALSKREYTILTIGLGDFEFELESRKSDAFADEEWIEDAKHHLEFAKSMSDEQWGFYCTLVSDYVWRARNLGEAFQDAREWAIEEMMQLKEEKDEAEEA